MPKVILAPRRDAGLAEERRRLVADERGDERRARQRRRAADIAHGVDDRGQQRRIEPEEREGRGVPRLDVGADEAGDAGVGAIGHVQRTVAQDPGDPRVDGGEAKIARRATRRD